MEDNGDKNALLPNKCRTKNTGTSNSKRTKRHSPHYPHGAGWKVVTTVLVDPAIQKARNVQYNRTLTIILCAQQFNAKHQANIVVMLTQPGSPPDITPPAIRPIVPAPVSTEPRSLRLDVHMRPWVLTRLQRSPRQRCHDDYRPLVLTFQPRTRHDLQDIFRDLRSCHLEAAQDSADQFAALPLFSRHYAETTTFPCLKLSVATDNSTLHTRYNMTNPDGLCGLNIVFQAWERE